jgi:DNA polymerase-3 subunit gamma/tau
MENFIVSARKYRPATFKQVVGQQAITTTLQSAIKNNHLAQAFLFTGPRGVGKTTCARILAKTINCLHPTSEMEPCNECESCTAFNNNASLNIYELDAASNNSVDDIRALVEQVRIPPQSGKYKVYIIDEVHMLSQAAFNAFLKTLEEPPEYAKFILATTEKHKILPTILSRCQIFDFKRISVDDIADHLEWVAQNEGVEAEREALHIIAQKADGALRDALSTFDQIVSFAGNKLTYKDVIENLNILDYEYYFKVVDFILNGDTANLLLTFHEILENGFDGQHFLTGLSEHFRQLLVVKDPATLKLLEAGPSLKEKYRQQSEKCNDVFILKALEMTNKYDLSYKTSNNKRLHVEIALIRLSSMQWQVKEAVVRQTTPVRQSTQKEVAEPAPKVKEEKKDKEKAANQTKNPTEVKEPKPSYPSVKPSASTTKPLNSEKAAKQNNTTPTDTREKLKLEDAKRKINNISIKNTLKGAKNKDNQTEEEETVIDNKFTREELIDAWKRFVEIYKEKSPSFSLALSKYEPELEEGFKIKMKTDSLLISKDLYNMTKLLEFLKAELNNNQITIKPVTLDEKEKRITLTDRERFEELVKKYPGIKTLKEKLNLEIDM